MNRAYGYLRVSTDAQAESGLGLDAQRTAITAAAARHGLALGDVFTDAGLSGRSNWKIVRACSPPSTP